jgi:hypothetical protein
MPSKMVKPNLRCSRAQVLQLVEQGGVGVWGWCAHSRLCQGRAVLHSMAMWGAPLLLHCWQWLQGGGRIGQTGQVSIARACASGRCNLCCTWLDPGRTLCVGIIQKRNGWWLPCKLGTSHNSKCNETVYCCTRTACWASPAV